MFRVQMILTRLLVQLLVLVSLHAAASDLDKELREMDLASAYDPRGTVERGEVDLRAAWADARRL